MKKQTTSHAARWHLAQANIARMLAPLNDPIMEGFVAQLEAINEAADQAPGFVWRLQTEEGDSTAVRAMDDEAILFNCSVWASVDDLHSYTYRSQHLAPFGTADPGSPPWTDRI